MLDARFDYFPGILDQSLSDGLGPAQGVSVGSLEITNTGDTAMDAPVIQDERLILGTKLTGANSGQDTHVFYNADLGIVAGQHFKWKTIAPNTAAPARSYRQGMFSDSLPISNSARNLGIGFAGTQAVVWTEADGTQTVPASYVLNGEYEFLVVQDSGKWHCYSKGPDYGWTLDLISTQGLSAAQYWGFLQRDDTDVAPVLQIDIGDDGASILDSRGPNEAVAPYDPDAEWIDRGGGIWECIAPGNILFKFATASRAGWYSYKVEITEVSGFTTGLQVVIGSASSDPMTTVDTHEGVMQCTDTIGFFRIAANQIQCKVNIATVEIKEITAPASTIDNLKGNIVSASFGPAEGPGDLKGPNVITAAIADYDTSGGGSTFDGTHWVVDGTQISFASIGQLGQATVGLTYEMTFEIVEITAGTVSALFGTAIVGSFDTPGVHTIQGEQVGNLGLFMRGDVDFVGKLGVLSVVQVYPNTLVLNDLDELHDDYPANGVGKIRRGILVKNGTTVATLSGGIADTGGVGNDLTEKFTNVPEPGLTLMANAHIPHNSGFFSALATWSRVANPAVNDTDYWYQIRGLSADAGSNMDCRVSDGVGNLETIILPIWLQDEYNRMAMTIGGFDASGQPDPAGPFGCIFKHNDVAVYSSAVQQAAADCFGSGLTSPGRAQYDSLQTKIDKGALATPQRALFNDTFKFGPETMDSPDFQDLTGWYTAEWTVVIGSASVDQASGNLYLEQTLGYRKQFYTNEIAEVTIVVDEYIGAGDLIVGLGSELVYLPQSAGTYVVQLTCPTDNQYVTLVTNGTIKCTVSFFGVKAASGTITDYIPENGVPFVETRGNMDVSAGTLIPAAANNWQHIAFDNPGGSFWEMLAACGNTNVHSVGINFRYEANNNHWRAEIRGEGNYILNLYEIISGSNQLRATADTGIAAGPSTFVRVIATDDGENMTVICVDSATVISHASTVDNDKTGAGLELRSGPTAANTKVDWFAARTGSVRAWS
jgi:hypothetical protein